MNKLEQNKFLSKEIEDSLDTDYYIFYKFLGKPKQVSESLLTDFASMDFGLWVTKLSEMAASEVMELREKILVEPGVAKYGALFLKEASESLESLLRSKSSDMQGIGIYKEKKLIGVSVVRLCSQNDNHEASAPFWLSCFSGYSHSDVDKIQAKKIGLIIQNFLHTQTASTGMFLSATVPHWNKASLRFQSQKLGLKLIQIQLLPK